MLSHFLRLTPITHTLKFQKIEKFEIAHGVSTRQPLQNRDKFFGLGENRVLGTSIGTLKEKKFGFEKNL